MKKTLMIILALVMALTMVMGSIGTVSAKGKPGSNIEGYAYFAKHYYKVIYVSEGYSWAQAHLWTINAPNITDDVRGIDYAPHLATITSGREFSFVVSLLEAQGTGCIRAFVGGEQASDAYGPSDGWSWVTGERWRYTNWNVDQPSDYCYSVEDCHLEDKLEMLKWPTDWGWNDVDAYGVTINHFVVEYEPVP